jgi:hypothetical protein
MLKRVDPNKVSKVVSLSDEAIDAEKSDLKSYRETADISKLVIKDGQHPTYFLAKPISHVDKVNIDNEHFDFVIGPDNKPTVKIKNGSMMSHKFFQHCVKQVEENGKISDVKPDDFTSNVIQEIGSYCQILATLGNG